MSILINIAVVFIATIVVASATVRINSHQDGSDSADPCSLLPSKKHCAAISRCQWCFDSCFSKSKGTCCASPVSEGSCGSVEYQFCNPNTQVCDNPQVYYPSLNSSCTEPTCCPKDKPLACKAMTRNASCYSDTNEKCCPGRGVSAPKDAQCCNASAFAGVGACPKGQKCCGGTGLTPVVCCAEADVCHTNEYGNFCTKPDLPGVCNADLGKSACLAALNGTTGHKACQWCRGECTYLRDGKCCTNVENYCETPYSKMCSSDQVCANYNTTYYNKKCDFTSCCPTEKSALCVGYGPNNGGCFDPKVDKCCGYPVNNQPAIAPINAVCCYKAAEGAASCPAGGTCCGSYPTICCAAGTTCDDSTNVNKCIPNKK